jgi:epoxide hydrolase-like predicted phosphatase
LAAATQAVVFDFGGVMTTEPDREAVVGFIRSSFHFSQEEFEKVNLQKRKAVKEGKTDAEFWTGYAKESKTTLPAGWESSFNQVLKDSIGVNPAMYTLVGELRGKGLPVALLSNIDERLSHLLRGFGFYDPFSPCLLSCEIGVEKPDPRIYEVLIGKMGVPPGEIVFVDDKLENIESARKLGIDGIHFTSQEQLVNELKARGVL